MIRYVSLGFLLIIMMLAILSRKNYSKYKDGENIFWSISHMLVSLTPDNMRRYVMKQIRRVSIINIEMLNQKTDMFIRKMYHDVLIILCSASAGLFVLSFIPEQKVDEYKVKRPEVGADSEVINLQLYDEKVDKKEELQVEVSPRVYTDAEFKELSEQAMKYMDSVILGENSDYEYITHNMYFPTKDETGNLRIEWETSDPVLVSSSGEINTTDLDKPEEVSITAEIKDDVHTVSKEYEICLVKEENLSSSERAKEAILSIEENNRSEEELQIPEKINEINISRKVKTRSDNLMTLFVLIFIVAVILGYYRIYKLKEKGDKRDDSLKDSYFGFVNRLTIHIGAGLTMQDALRAVVSCEDNTYLRGEVEYALNRVSSGVSERVAYIDLGNSIGLQEYIRLMSLIVQNLAYGNSNLIKLLNDEIKDTFYIKREHIRKKGEKASEKLLLPTSILLILVIIIVMYPAFIQM